MTITVHQISASPSAAPRLSRPVGASAAEGLARALARAGVRSSLEAASASSQPARLASARPKSRVQIVANAVERDPACQGKAAAALALLANDELASVPGSGLVKLLRATPASEANAMLRDTCQVISNQQAATKANAIAAMWDRVIANFEAEES